MIDRIGWKLLKLTCRSSDPVMSCSIHEGNLDCRLGLQMAPSTSNVCPPLPRRDDAKARSVGFPSARPLLHFNPVLPSTRSRALNEDQGRNCLIDGLRRSVEQCQPISACRVVLGSFNVAAIPRRNQLSLTPEQARVRLALRPLPRFAFDTYLPKGSEERANGANGGDPRRKVAKSHRQTMLTYGSGGLVDLSCVLLGAAQTVVHGTAQDTRRARRREEGRDYRDVGGPIRPPTPSRHREETYARVGAPADHRRGTMDRRAARISAGTTGSTPPGRRAPNHRGGNRRPFEGDGHHGWRLTSRTDRQATSTQEVTALLGGNTGPSQHGS